MTLASYLQHQKQWQVTLIEKSKKWQDICFNIALWASGTEILAQLGLLEKFKEKSLPMNFSDLYDHTGKLISRISFNSVGTFGLNASISRSDLHKILINSLKEVEVRFNTQVQDLKIGRNNVQVLTNQRREEIFDLVVAGDGVNSATRLLVNQANAKKSYHWYLIAFWLPAGMAPSNLTHIDGESFMAFIIPAKERAAMGIIKKVASDFSAPKNITAGWLKDFTSGMGPFVEKAASSLADFSTIYQDSLKYAKVGKWNNQRVVYIGDSQHGVSPISGLGASLALEDGFVLGEELGKIGEAKYIDSAINNFVTRRERKLKYARKFIKVTENYFMRVQSPQIRILRNKIIQLFPTLGLTYLKNYLKESL